MPLCHYCSDDATPCDFELPVNYSERTGHFTLVHGFCGPPCALSYAWTQFGSAQVSSITFWIQLLAQKLGYDGLTQAAPPRERLVDFGGDLMRSEYRAMIQHPHTKMTDPLYPVPVYSVTEELARIRTARPDIHASQPILDALRAALDPSMNPELPPTLVRTQYGKKKSIFNNNIIIYSIIK